MVSEVMMLSFGGSARKEGRTVERRRALAVSRNRETYLLAGAAATAVAAASEAAAALEAARAASEAAAEASEAAADASEAASAAGALWQAAVKARAATAEPATRSLRSVWEVIIPGPLGKWLPRRNAAPSLDRWSNRPRRLYDAPTCADAEYAVSYEKGKRQLHGGVINFQFSPRRGWRSGALPAPGSWAGRRSERCHGRFPRRFEQRCRAGERPAPTG